MKKYKYQNKKLNAIIIISIIIIMMMMMKNISNVLCMRDTYCKATSFKDTYIYT